MYIADFEPINKKYKQFGIRLADFIEKYNLPAYRNTLNIVLPIYTINESQFENTGETMTVYASNNTYLYLYTRYYNRIVTMYNLTGEDFDFSLCFAEFLTLFNDYMERKSDSWGRIISARASDFSPIANYDKYLDGVLKYEGSENNATEYGGIEKNTQTETGKETNTTNYGTKTETDTSQNTTYDSANYNDVSKNTNSVTAHTDSNERSFENRKTENIRTFTDRIDVSAKSFENRKDINTLHEYGNIGVQTTISILNEYLSFYRKDVVSEILSDFMDEISFY